MTSHQVGTTDEDSSSTRKPTTFEIAEAWGIDVDAKPTYLPPEKQGRGVNLWSGEYIMGKMVVVASVESYDCYMNDQSDSYVGIVYKEDIEKVRQQGRSVLEAMAQSACHPATEGRKGAMEMVLRLLGMPKD